MKKIRNKKDEAVEKHFELNYELFKSLINCIGLGINIVSKDYKILYINKVTAKWFRKPAKHIIGKKCYNEFEKRDSICSHCPGKKAMETGEAASVDTEGVRDNGDKFSVHISAVPLFDSLGNVIGFIEILDDITNRKKAEETLRASEARYKSFIEAAEQIAWGTDNDGQVVEDIPSFRKFTGQTYKEVKGSGWTKALHPDDIESTLQEWNNAIKEKSKYEIEYRMRRYDGVYRDLLARSFPVFRDDGTIREWVGTCIDITKHKKMYNLINELSKLQTSLLTHETLRNKLKLITDYIVKSFNADFARIWLIRRGDRCDYGCPHAKVSRGSNLCRYKEHCLHLFSSSGRYTDIDGDFYARIPFGCYKIGTIASGKNPSFLTNDVINDPQIHNRKWAKQLGLVSFAGFQLLPPGDKVMGVMALFSKNKISPDEFIMLEILSKVIMRVVVKDTGVGISKEVQGKIFDSFFTTKTLSKGIGLGLPVVDRIIKRHNGAIAVWSKLEKGTAFTIYLPVAHEISKNEGVEDGKTEKAVKLVNVGKTRRKVRILVVDDNQSLLKSYKITMKKLKYTVTTATDGAAALKLFCAAPDNFDVVLADQVMPNMTGVHLSAEILKIRPNMPIIIITGYSNVPKSEAIKLGIKHFMTKPIKFSVLSELINSIMDRKKSASK